MFFQEIYLTVSIDLLAKGSLLLILIYMLNRILAKQSARDRYFIRSLAFYMILLLPLLSLFLPRLPIEIFDAKEKTSLAKIEKTRETSTKTNGFNSNIAAQRTIQVKENSSSLNELWSKVKTLTLFEILILIWLSVALLIYLKLIIGLLSIWWTAKRSEAIKDREWNLLSIDLSNSLGLKRNVKLLRSKKAFTPMTWGIFQPFVLLPEDSKEWSLERLRYVLIHEFSHVKRKDFIQHLSLQLVCSLMWFNPLVWSISKQIVADREKACDDEVILEGAKASRYAEHLIDIAKSLRFKHHSTYASVCMARHNQLEGRLLSILDSKNVPSNKGWMKYGFISLFFLIVLPLSAIHPVEKSSTAINKEAHSEPINLNTSSDLKKKTAHKSPIKKAQRKNSINSEKRGNPSKRAQKRNTRSQQSINEIVNHEVSKQLNKAFRVIPHAKNNPSHVEINAKPNLARAVNLNDSLSIDDIIQLKRYGVTIDYIKEIKKLGFDYLSIDDVINFARYGVDASYVEAVRKSGFKFLKADDVCDMKRYGVKNSLIKAVKNMGFADISVNEVTEFARYGVNASYIKAIHEAGFKRISASDITEMARYGVDANYIRKIRKEYPNASADDIAEMKRYGVSLDFISSLKKAGYEDARASEITEASRYGVRSSYIEKIRNSGLKTSLAEISEMKRYGVSPAFIQSLRDAGFKNLDAEDITNASRYGVRSDFIQSLKNMKYDFSLEEIVEMTRYGVRSNFIQSLSDAGYKKLSGEEISDMAKYGVTANYINSLKAAGLKRISAEDISEMAKHGVSSRKIKAYKAVGYSHLSAESLVDFQKYGVSTKLIASLKKAGYENLDPEDLVDFAKYGVSSKLIASLKAFGYKKLSTESLIDCAKYGVTDRYLTRLKNNGVKKVSISTIIKMKKYGIEPDYIKKMRDLDDN